MLDVVDGVREERAFRRKHFAGRTSRSVEAHPSVATDYRGYIRLQNKMPDVDLANRHPALQSMCSKD
jgi:hypothetical protein